jgi:hypothetical protein
LAKFIPHVKFPLILVFIRETFMQLETKIGPCGFLSQGVFCLLSAMLFSACTVTPTKFTIDPPYYVYDSSDKTDIKTQKTKIKMQQYAQAICEHHRKVNLKSKKRPPNPFTSDGCSLSPDGNWKSCCIEHDISYWCGGTMQDRTDADNNLESCIGDKGHAYYGWATNNIGVQTGGSPLWPTSFRWGYGWPYPYSYDSEK